MKKKLIQASKLIQYWSMIKIHLLNNMIMICNMSLNPSSLTVVENKKVSRRIQIEMMFGEIKESMVIFNLPIMINLIALSQI